MKIGTVLSSVGLSASLIIGFLMMGCNNAGTPAGFEGYVTQGAWFGSKRFYAAQEGPTSTGMGWMLFTDNVDMRWNTLNEEFQVMSSDNLSLSFNAHLVMRPKKGTIKMIVEDYGGEVWYVRNIQQPFRNAVYEAVAGYRALEAKDKREEIAAKASGKFQSFIADKPFEVQAIVIGVINLPKVVADAQEIKISKETELERKGFEIKIAEQDSLVRVAEARGIAEAQKIIQASLTPLYLQHEAIKSQEKMAGSPNHTVVYIPSGAGGVPLVGTVPTTQAEKP